MLDIKDFEEVSEHRWKSLISKALKINSLDDFADRIAEGISFESFHYPTHSPTTNYPLELSKSGWLIGLSLGGLESIPNDLVIRALQNGTEALGLNVTAKTDWTELYEGVFFEMFYNDFALLDDKAKILDVFIDYGIDQNKDIRDIRGSVHLDSNELVECDEYLEKLPSFHFHTVKSDASDIQSELNELSTKLNDAIDLLINHRLPLSIIRLSTKSGTHLPVNVAKLRAIRMIWANLLKAKELKNEKLFIVCHTKVSSELSKESFLIYNTMATINAIYGNVDLIYGGAKKPNFEDLRLNQNIQHILKAETKLDSVKDPLAGSYAIEKMSANLAQHAWDHLIKTM